MRIPGISCEIQGAIFDFDGTLMDSMPDWAGKMLHLLDNHGTAYPTDVIRTILPLGDKGAADYFREQLGLELTKEQILQELDAYALPKYRDSILPKPGAVKLLNELQAEGVPVCILTASPQHMIRPCLARNGLEDRFAYVWCCDDLGMKKNETKIYTWACAQIGTEPGHTLFFDDNLLALRTAAEAGLAAVGIYDASAAADEELARSVCTRYLRCWDELLQP